MIVVNSRRVWLGAVAGFVVWAIWGALINLLITGARYAEGQKAGLFLASPRYPFFIAGWLVTLLVLAYFIAWLYASARATRGAGPKTALLIALGVGFAAGFPISFSMAAWWPGPRFFPLWWMLELWVGALLSGLVSGWLYRDR